SSPIRGSGTGSSPPAAPRNSPRSASPWASSAGTAVHASAQHRLRAVPVRDGPQWRVATTPREEKNRSAATAARARAPVLAAAAAIGTATAASPGLGPEITHGIPPPFGSVSRYRDVFRQPLFPGSPAAQPVWPVSANPRPAGLKTGNRCHSPVTRKIPNRLSGGAKFGTATPGPQP